MFPLETKVNEFKNLLDVQKLGKESDQLSLSIRFNNKFIAEEYLNALMLAFDNDGILDRRLEYVRTIDFVNEREKILKSELELVELRKQNFKQDNNLSNLSVDADNNIDLKYSYNSELFQSESQKSIANYLLESISEKEYDYFPLNIGLENFDLNNMIIEYNKTVTKRKKLLPEAGVNNYLVISLNSQLDDLKKNILTSIQRYISTINLKIENLKVKESEFDLVYNKVPKNEKTLDQLKGNFRLKKLYIYCYCKREKRLQSI